MAAPRYTLNDIERLRAVIVASYDPGPGVISTLNDPLIIEARTQTLLLANITPEDAERELTHAALSDYVHFEAQHRFPEAIPEEKLVSDFRFNCARRWIEQRHLKHEAEARARAFCDSLSEQHEQSQHATEPTRENELSTVI